jgi:2-hydroxy-3-keto-5-methylthiopentenyl-1-phosphate phosphatase
MIIQCDFDGTIITNNLSILLREQFASSEWRVVESDYLAGRLTVEESNRRQYLMIKEPSEVLQSFVLQNIRVRPGFLDFVEYCHDRGLRLAIVSSGLDFYIKTVLKSIGIPDMEVYCASTLFGQDGITVQYIDPEGYEVTDGFKRRCFTWLRNRGGSIIYIGDGLSDLDVAVVADYVFAADHLHRLLQEASVPHYQFFSFTEIMHQMSRLALPG